MDEKDMGPDLERVLLGQAELAEGIARLCAVIPGARERIRRYLTAPLYVLPPPERSRSAAASSTVIAR